MRVIFPSFWAQCIANRSAWLNCINYHTKTLIYMFYNKFLYMFLGCIWNDLEVHRWPWSYLSSLMSLHAKLCHPRVNSLRVTWYAYSLFTQGGYPRMGYKYGSLHVINRLHSSFRFVWGITSQGQLSSIGRARASGPRALNKHYSARGVSINVSFMYIT